MIRLSIKFFKIFFPVLFIWYAGSVSLFIHSHVINGVTIIHSHPFEKDSKAPVHHHGKASEVQFIHSLSHIQIAHSLLFIVLFGLFLLKPVKILIRPEFKITKCFRDRTISLRAPPLAA